MDITQPSSQNTISCTAISGSRKDAEFSVYLKNSNCTSCSQSSSLTLFILTAGTVRCCPMLLRYPQQHGCVGRFPKLPLFVFLLTVVLRCTFGGMKLTAENCSTGSKPSYSATFSTTNSTCTNLGSNLGLPGEKRKTRNGPLLGHTASHSTEKQSARKGCFVRREIEAELEYSQKKSVNFLHSAACECNSDAAVCLDAPNVFTFRVIP